MIKRVITKIKNFIWQKKRNKINHINRNRLNEVAKTTSIISMNCVGGIISHDLGMKFLSPTINLFMNANDYIKFCENLKYYLSINNFVEVKEDRDYPVAKLGDLTLYLVHYHSVKEAEDKWNERKSRVNFDNLAIICCDREGMTDELTHRFDSLPYSKKVMFTHKPNKYDSCYYIKGYENDGEVGIITLGYGTGGLRPIDQFDYVEFLNRQN